MKLYEMWGFIYLCEAIAIVSVSAIVSAIWEALKKTIPIHNWLVQRKKNKKRREKNKHRYLPYV